jgi:hypothetical protein
MSIKGRRGSRSESPTAVDSCGGWLRSKKNLEVRKQYVKCSGHLPYSVIYQGVWELSTPQI